MTFLVAVSGNSSKNAVEIPNEIAAQYLGNRLVFHGSISMVSLEDFRFILRRRSKAAFMVPIHNMKYRMNYCAKVVA